MTQVPIIINNRNIFGWCRDMVEYLKRIPDTRVIVLDNQSSYKPLLAYYDTHPCEIVRLPSNMGKLAPWKSGLVDKLGGEYYVVTDPDLDLSGVPLDVLDVLRAGMEKYEVCKAGLSLAIDDLPADGVRFGRSAGRAAPGNHCPA